MGTVVIDEKVVHDGAPPRDRRWRWERRDDRGELIDHGDWQANPVRALRARTGMVAQPRGVERVDLAQPVPARAFAGANLARLETDLHPEE